MKAGDHRHQAAHDDRDAEADEALHDHLAGHRADRRTRQPGRQQRGQKHARRAGAEQRRQRRIGGLDFGDVAMALVERARRHHHHRHIDETGDRQGDRRPRCWRSAATGGARRRCAPGARFWVRPECRKMACGMIVAPTMPTAIVRAPASGNCGTIAPKPAARPIDRRDEHFDEIAKRDGGDQSADNHFGRTKPSPFEHQNAVGQHRRDAHAGEQRNVQDQRKTDGAAEEFGEVGRHRRHFADDPQGVDDRLRKMLAAHLGEIAPGDDAELGRQRLEQHRDRIGHQHDPQQRVAVFRAGLDVGGEIAGVHIGDRGDHRRPGEQQRAEPPRLAGQNVADPLDGPVRHSRVASQRRSLASHIRECLMPWIREYSHCYVIVNRLRNGAKA